jgi:DNA-directed RNA polymerase subunit M/transcription elongation factor TFIIS
MFILAITHEVSQLEKKYRNKISQVCPQCDKSVLAIRINGFYSGDRDRVFLWECPLCANVWRGARPELKNTLI